MDLKQETFYFVEYLQTLYFEKRDIDSILAVIDQDTSWIGTDAQELCRNLEDAKKALVSQIQEYKGRFTITQTKYDAVCLSDTVCMVYGEITAKPEHPDFADLYNRLTAVCVRKPEGMKLVHLHLSVPDTNQKKGSFLVMRGASKQNEILQKKEQDELRLSLERYRIIMDQTTDIIFEWDIKKDTLSFSSNWRKKFGYEPIGEAISKRIPNSCNIHPEDMPAFLKIMKDSAAGVPYSETEFRIRDIFGNFVWSRIRATVQYDMLNRPVKAVGVIIDINSDKKRHQLLLEQAQRDPLTNLYNKVAARELIEQKMSENFHGEEQVLLIIDVDDFKRVNDVYGHLCGDSLLADVAATLRSQFRDSDLVARIGGDEFLIYLPGTEKEEMIKKIGEVLEALKRLRPVKGAPPISCSIGAAIYPKDADNYFSLFKCADTSLYHIKNSGKAGFFFYDPTKCEKGFSSDIIQSVVGAIDSELQMGDTVGEKLAQYTFRMLYNAIDVNTAVSQLLEIVGRAYNVSRVYIFESSEDGKKCSNTFEWCNAGVEPQIHHLKDIAYDNLGNFRKNFDKDGIFYCRDIRELDSDLWGILAPQGICSLLQCAIMDDDVFMGYVGFDECRENRAWTKEQIVSLTLIANVLSTFLLKLRLKERFERIGAE